MDAQIATVQAAAFAHPVWLWLGAAAALLVVELVTGSGYLLWASASAAAVALLPLFGAPLGRGGEAVVFSVLAVGSTYLARRFWPRRQGPAGVDVSNLASGLVGREGRCTCAFADGAGRVFVDGKEWAAEAASAPGVGEAVRVTAIVDGGRLRVAPL